MGDSLADILARLTVLTDNEQTAQTTPTAPRVRAINCKPFSIGQDWSSFSVYFRENVRAAHGLNTETMTLNYLTTHAVPSSEVSLSLVQLLQLI